MPKENKLPSTERVFGVYQQEAGSLTLAGHRFSPLQPAAVPAAVAETADPESSPVRFFATEDEAANEVVRLKRKFDAAKPQTK